MDKLTTRQNDGQFSNIEKGQIITKDDIQEEQFDVFSLVDFFKVVYISMQLLVFLWEVIWQPINGA